jgi:LytS/YehU family sensor histidine kinase
MLSLLSDFLRLALQEVATHIVPLRRELDFTDLYLEIQKLRFTDRLNVIREIDPGVLDWPVPHLLLQPLVENAIIHGFGRKIEPGTVRISARREREHLLLQVIDDGMGLKAPIGSGSCAGLGLKNARERLSQLYGQDGRLDCSEGPGGGFVVAMRIPCVGSMLNPKQVQP